MNIAFKEAKDTYWKYYISLEKQFMETERYVEFDYVNNGKVYSMEYMKLFQAVCSEIDVVGKILAQCINPSYKPDKKTGINEWWYHIQTAYPDLKDRKYIILDEREMQPWKDFIVIQNPNKKAKRYILDENTKPKGQTPNWWNDYNSAKHNRTGRKDKKAPNYANANLRNLFISFAALFSLEELLLDQTFTETDEPINIEFESKMFRSDLPFFTQPFAVRQ